MVKNSLSLYIYKQILFEALYLFIWIRQTSYLSQSYKSGLMYKWPLHRLCVLGNLGKLVGAEPLPKVWGALVYERCSCLLPFFWWKWAYRMYSGMLCSNLAGRPKQMDRAPAHAIEVEEDINNGAPRTLENSCSPQELTKSSLDSPVFSR